MLINKGKHQQRVWVHSFQKHEESQRGYDFIQWIPWFLISAFFSILKPNDHLDINLNLLFMYWLEDAPFILWVWYHLLFFSAMGKYSQSTHWKFLSYSYWFTVDTINQGFPSNVLSFNLDLSYVKQTKYSQFLDACWLSSTPRADSSGSRILQASVLGFFYFLTVSFQPDVWLRFTIFTELLVSVCCVAGRMVGVWRK